MEHVTDKTVLSDMRLVITKKKINSYNLFSILLHRFLIKLIFSNMNSEIMVFALKYRTESFTFYPFDTKQCVPYFRHAECK